MAITWRDGIIVGAIVLGLILLISLVVIFANQTSSSSTSMSASAMVAAAHKSAHKSAPLGSVGGFASMFFSRLGNGAVSEGGGNHRPNPPRVLPKNGPPASPPSCPQGSAATHRGAECKPFRRAALDMDNDACPSLVPAMAAVCEQPPKQWTLNSTYTGLPEYFIGSEAGICVEPKGDISVTNIATTTSVTTGTLSGGHAVLHLTNNGQCDARLVNIVVQLIKVKRGACERCLDTCDDPDNDAFHDSDKCDLARKGRVVAATAEESADVRNCPNGGRSPATLCLTHGDTNRECLVQVPYNESVHITDATTEAPIHLGDYVIPKKTKCGNETVIAIDYEFSLTLAQLAALQNEQFVVKIFVTYDTCCNKGHTCGIDYDCDGIVETIRTIHMESPCFALPATCPQPCASGRLVQRVDYRALLPAFNFSSLSAPLIPLSGNTTVIFAIAESTPPPVAVVVPEVCCDAARDALGLQSFDFVLLEFILETRMEFATCPAQDVLHRARAAVVCDPIIISQEPVDCQVTEWSEWTPTCALNSCAPHIIGNCTQMMQKRLVGSAECLACACSGGSNTRSREIVQPPLDGGAACPNTTESRACQSQEVIELSPCTCPGPTQNVTLGNLPGANPGVNCVPNPADLVDCDTTTCNADCSVSEWTQWSPCTQSNSQALLCSSSPQAQTCTTDCYTGTRTRTRNVLQEPEGSGQLCPALSDSALCNSTSVTQTPCTASNACSPAGCLVTDPFNPLTCPYPRVECL